jgi:hypothetical protein
MLNIAFFFSRRSRRNPVEEKKGSREPAWASSPSTSSRGQRPQFWSRPESPGDSSRQSPSLTRVKIEKTERKRSRSRSRKRSPKKKQKQRRRDRSASDTDHWASGTSLYRDEYCERDGDFADNDKLSGRKRSSFEYRERYDERRFVRVKKEKHIEKKKTPSREVSHERDRGKGRTEKKERKRHSESLSDSREWSHDREHVRVKKEKEKHKKRKRRRESPRGGSELREYFSPERKPVFYKVKREKKEKELVANPFAESSGSQSESLDTSRESERRRQRRRKKAKRRRSGVKQESGSSSSSTDTERQDGAETPPHGSRIKEEKDETEMAAA